MSNSPSESTFLFFLTTKFRNLQTVCSCLAKRSEKERKKGRKRKNKAEETCLFKEKSTV